MWFHGYPSSRLEGQGVDKIAHQLGVRVIAPDHPGFGLSDVQPRRRILDWPADVQALASHLGLSRFAVLGGSGGAPYALACAHALPADMLSGVGIMAGAGPWQAGAHHMPLLYRVTAQAANYWPAALRRSLDCLVWILRKVMATPTVTRWLDHSIQKSISGEEQENGRSVEERRQRMLRMMFEGFAQGSDASVEEAKLLTQDWGIPFEDVKYDPILMWHGTKDYNAPVAMVRYMAERLPHCVLKEYEDHTHFTMHALLEEIVAELVPAKE
jgi:pimeloyl-ACP methyl ester carboxylesterase